MRKPPEGYAWSRFGQPEYTDWLDESLSWKSTCYIGDWSFLWQHRITGPDALTMLGDITVNSFASFEYGRSKHAIHTDRDGKVIHEGVLTRFGDQEFMLHGRSGFWARHYLSQTDYDAKIEQDNWFVLQVSGPTSVKVLEKASGRSRLRETGFMRINDLTVAGHEIWALRQGMAGEIGFELQGPMAHKQDVYDAIVEAGQEFGIRKLGGRTTMINHLEACFPTIATDYIPAIFTDDMAAYRAEFTASMPAFAQAAYIAGSYDGSDISEYYRSPVELGWGRNIAFDHDFLGRDALEAEKAAPRRVMRTLEWNGEDVADVFASLLRPGDHYPFMDMPRDQRGFMWADQVTAGDDLVGVATSRGYSYTYRRMLSLCTIDVARSEPGTEVVVHWGEPGGPHKAIRATVAPAPYKPDRRRADLRQA
jgi:vanillate/3-O-methylgallate O-demethylase